MVQTQLGRVIAGATIEVDGVRTLVINTAGKNENVWVRRSTYAHELCHLLWDPGEVLTNLRVDDYDAMERTPEKEADPVEQRANAFSAELIAPQVAALSCYRQSDGSPSDRMQAVLDEFSVSFWAGRYQVWNASRRSIPFEELTVTNYLPSGDAAGRESYTSDFFPLPLTPQSRRGRFSAVVVLAAEEGLVSWQTAAEYLLASEDEVRSVAAEIRDLFPDVTPRR